MVLNIRKNDNVALMFNNVAFFLECCIHLNSSKQQVGKLPKMFGTQLAESYTGKRVAAIFAVIFVISPC